MNHTIKSALAVIVALLFAFAPLANASAILAPTVSTSLTYNVGESLTLSVDTSSLALTTTQQTIHVTTSWALAAPLPPTAPMVVSRFFVS
jgi:hypothetical protein